VSDTVTLVLPEELARRARDEARRSHRRLEDVVLGWLGQVAAERPIEDLSDVEILALCDLQLAEPLQAELSQLLDRQRESQLDVNGRRRLDEVMATYRRGLVRKARATTIAVERGLRPSLS
jgi:hypothetical protein